MDEDLIKQATANRAVEIGIEDDRLLWIARQSLEAALPEGWVECQSEDGYIYYYNDVTDESKWEHPNIEYYKNLYQQQLQLLKSGGATNESKSPVRNVWDKTKDKKEKSDNAHPAANSVTSVNMHTVANTSNYDFKNDDDAPFELSQVNFWKEKYDTVLAEKRKLDESNKKLENVLQDSVLEQATLHKDIHKLVVASEESARSLRSHGVKIIEYLEQRGFTNSTKYHKDNVQLPLTCDETCKLMDFLLQVAKKSPDDSGYVKSWDGVGKRLTDEMYSCFKYDKKGIHIGTEMEELKARIEVLAQVICTFGEYLSVTDRETYINALLKHIMANGSDGTMVPLELIVKQIPQNSSSNHSNISHLALDPPSNISELRRLYDEEKQTNNDLRLQLEKLKGSNDIMNLELQTAQKKCDEALIREESAMNKFNILSKMMEEIKDIQTLSKSGVITNGADNASEMAALVNKAKGLSSELDLANRRATEAERRFEELLQRENQMKNDISVYENKMMTKMNKKKHRIQELIEKNAELDKVAKEMFNELQIALGMSSKLDKDCNELRVQLDLVKSGDDALEGLKLRLEDESSRSKSLEKTVNKLRREIEDNNVHHVKQKEYVQRMESQLKTLVEDTEHKHEEAKTYRLRSERLAEDKAILRESINSLKQEVRRLNDRIADIQGSIRVFCRVRENHVSDYSDYVRFPSNDSYLEFNNSIFEFDKVFNPALSQEDVFDELGSVVRSTINGHRLCIFAYGVTGAGKTFTMLGNKTNPGVTLRAVESLLQHSSADSETFNTTIKVSIYEVYNEKLTDLLGNNLSVDLDIRVTKDGGSHVENGSEWPIYQLEDFVSLLDRGETSRRVASNNINDHSSRSHFIIQVVVDRENINTGLRTRGCLTLVDLAGSERVKLSDSSVVALRESQHINSSLTALSDVINAFSAGQKQIPYRNSKLTFLLQESLRENAKVVMFVNINPVEEYIGESTFSLHFASKCRSVKLGASKPVSQYQPSYDRKK